MPKFIPVKYHARKYPSHITPLVTEIAAHFDVDKINPRGKFSLHTEYSYANRKLNSELISSYKNITRSHVDFVPQLWRDELWATEFYEFIMNLADGNQPDIVEIHPPFNDYCPDVKSFLDIYSVFENRLLNAWNGVLILLENRSGSIYRNGDFLISKYPDLVSLCNEIEKRKLHLKIALDIPQLFTAHGGPFKITLQDISQIVYELKPIRTFIGGIHLWGKRKNANGKFISHVGDLSSYFNNNSAKKAALLESLKNLFDDELQRFFVPEVNSGDQDLASIISDLEQYGFSFE